MTQAQQPVRDVLRPSRRPGHLGVVHIVQLILAETAVIAVLGLLDQGVLVLAAAIVVGTAILFLALGRQRGRWWVERQVLMRRYRRRRRASPEQGTDTPQLAALRTLAGGLTVRDVAAADGAPVGVARDDAGWFAVAAVGVGSPMRTEPGDQLPLHVLASALADSGQAGAVLQVVRHTVPPPDTVGPPTSAADHSYRELIAGSGGAPAPMDSVTWVALRLDARSLAEASVGVGVDLNAAPPVVAAMIRTVTKDLRHAGVTCQVLDAAGLVEALARSCDLGSAAAGVTAVPKEEWYAWHSAGLAHRTFWIRKWPPVERAGALLDQLAITSASMTSVAMILAPSDEDDLVDLRCLVRVAAPAQRLKQVSDLIFHGARRAHAELFPLDGEQGPAVYASAPTGGGAL